MISRIYIDNYKCLSNFVLEPTSYQLWLGNNGSGKTSVVDALHFLQHFISGDPINDILSSSSLTTWDKRKKQTFSISVAVEEDTFDYVLILEHLDNGKEAVISREELKWQGQTFYFHDGRDAHLFRINRFTNEVEEGTSFPAKGGRTIMATIDARDDNQPLIAFRDIVSKWLLIQPVPMLMEEAAEEESAVLDRYCRNIAQWYRHLLQEHPKIIYDAKLLLDDALPGFEQVSIKKQKGVRTLNATFKVGDNTYDFDFHLLSDGQRQLILLHTLLEALRAGLVTTLIIDEPDNNVSLREIQPWLGELKDICEDTGNQALIISHHPEVINMMARGDERWFSRNKGGQVQVQDFPTTPGLTPAETMARGWDSE